MTQVWDENNKLILVTVVQADSNVITQLRNAETDGYVAVQIGYGQIDPCKVTKPLAGHFEKAGVTLAATSSNCALQMLTYELGQELSVELFEAGQKIDVVGTTKGKGFAGVAKRHGFHGVGASHGAHKNHRKPGSIGGASTPSRVFKGMKMAGRMGAVRHTTLNLTVHAVDVEKSLFLIKGAVPRRPRPGHRTHRRGGAQFSDYRQVDRLQRSSTATNVLLLHQVATLSRRCSPGTDKTKTRAEVGAGRAVQAEGHRPRPSGFNPCSSHDRWWRCPRPHAATTASAPPRR